LSTIFSIVDQKAVEMFTAETAKRTMERISLLKKAISDGNGSEDLKMVIAAYNPNILIHSITHDFSIKQ
jgi:RPA family protein